MSDTVAFRYLVQLHSGGFGFPDWRRGCGRPVMISKQGNGENKGFDGK